MQYAIQANGNNAGLYLTYTDILLMMGQTGTAIELLQKAVSQVTPKNSQLYGRIGELIYADGDKETGIEYLTEAVDIDPRNKRALEMLQHALKRRAESQAEILLESDIPPLPESLNKSSSTGPDTPTTPIGSPLDSTLFSSNQTTLTSSTTRNPPRKRLSVFF